MNTPLVQAGLGKHFGSLDGIRALSIIGVVWHHAARETPLPLAAEMDGARMFFAISGFLITTLLLRERDRSGTIALGAFFKRRSLRIFPLYFTVLLGYVIVVSLFAHDEPRATFFANLPYYLTYTSNWFVPSGEHVIFYFAWSLAAEEQFYLVWPAVEKWLGARHAPVLIAGAILAGSFLVRVEALPLEGVAETIVRSIVPATCLGVVLAHVLHDHRGFAIAARLLSPRWMSPLLLVAVVCSLYWTDAAGAYVRGAVMTLFVGACVVREDHGLARVLRWRPLVSIGQVSYGIYLMHMLVLNIAERAFSVVGVGHRVPIFVVTVLVAWGCALLSFRHYESRFHAPKSATVREAGAPTSSVLMRALRDLAQRARRAPPVSAPAMPLAVAKALAETEARGAERSSA